MLQDVISRLEWVGYTYVEDTDKDFIEYIIDKVSNEVKVVCNITDIPDELKTYIIDKSTGEFLLNRKGSGKLNLTDIDLDGTAKSIQLGDTKVEYNVDNNVTPEQRFDVLVNYLVANKKDLLVSFRKLRW